MKNLLYLVIAVFIFSSCDNTSGNEDPIIKTDSISMGASYADDVFYSLENGIVKNSPRAEWDIAFSTNPLSSTVLINEGFGTELYTYKNGALDAWDAIDTAGFSTWPMMYNADTTWYNGAFDRNALGHPDYGWGIYNMQSHDVLGDSLYIIKLSNGSLQKLAIISRAGATNTFEFKHGGLSEQGDLKSINCNDYSDKNFVYYSLQTGAAIDREPASDDWDLVFTKYHDESIPYIVTGVLSNDGVKVAEVSDMATELADASTAEYSEHINVIGSDWKEFDMGIFAYTIVEDLCYFVQAKDSVRYKMTFTGTDGSASGKMVFDIEEVK